MSVHYKFKSALDYDTVTFDGLHISVGDLKAAISQQKRIGKSSDFDLEITNAQTKEVYVDDQTLIPKNTSLLVARVPLSQLPSKKQWQGKDSINALKDVAPSKGLADLSRMEGSEQDKINAMISQSTLDYDPSNYQKIRGQNQRGLVPSNYICFKCQKRGHWIKDCPIVNNNPSAEPVEIKRSTGIPLSFMVPVEGPKAPGAMMTPSGTFAVPAVDREAYIASENAGGADTPTNAPAAPDTNIPDELICSLCRDLLTDAVMIPCCGNSFCDECIRGALLESEDHECPDCREKEISPTTLIPNRFLRNSVASFRNQTGYSRKMPHRPAAPPPQRPPPEAVPMQQPNGPGALSGPPHGAKPLGIDGPRPPVPARLDDHRSGTPTVDERRDPGFRVQPPPFVPGHPLGPGFTNRAPFIGPPPHIRPPFPGQFPLDPVQPPPPGIKDSPPANGAGPTEDPLEAFNRMIREKEMRAKRREEERRRMKSGSRSPRSRSRSPRPVRGSPRPVRVSPRPVRGSPRPVRGSPRPVRTSPRPVRDSRSPRSPRPRLRTPPPRVRYSRSRSPSPRVHVRGRRSPPPPWSPRRRRSRERSISLSRSPSPRRRHRSPMRFRSPLRSPPPRASRSPHRAPPPRNASPHRFPGLYDDMLSPPRRSVEPPYPPRYGPRANGPPQPYPPGASVPGEPPPGFRRYDVPPFDDVPPGVDPPVPGFEPPGFDKPPFGPPGTIDRPIPGYRDPGFRPPYVEGHPGFRDMPSQPIQNEIPVLIGEPPRYRDNFRPGPPGLPYREGQPPFRDPAQPYRGGPQLRDGPYRNGPYRDGPPPHGFRDGPAPFNPDQPPANYDPSFRDDRDHSRPGYRLSTRPRGAPRRPDYDRHREREARERERYNENRDPDRARDPDRRAHEKAREDRSREYRDREVERDRESERFTPERKGRSSPKKSRETREKRRSESRGRSREKERDKKERKEERVRDKSSAERTKEKEKKIKDKKKKKREKETDKEKKKKKKDKKLKKEDDEGDKSDNKDDNKEDSQVEKDESDPDFTEKLKNKDESGVEAKEARERESGDKIIIAPILKQESGTEDLYSGEATEAVDKETVQNYVKTEEGTKKPTDESNIDNDNKDEPFDGIELQAPADELELKSMEGHEKEMLAPLPALSKWEVDEDNNERGKEPGEISSPEPDESSKKVTSDVIKRAENALFSKNTTSVKPIAIKKTSTVRGKPYVGEKQSKHSIQITVPVAVTDHGVSDFSEKKRKHSKTPPRLSVKERLGGKVDVHKSRERVVHSTIERVKSRSKTPNKDQPYRRVTVERERGKKAESKEERRVTSEIIKTNSQSIEDQRKKPRDTSQEVGRERKKSTIDESHFEPDYDENVESDSESKPIKRENNAEMEATVVKKPKLDEDTIKLDLANVKKKPDTESDSSSDSESSSSSSEIRKKKKKKKKSSKKKRKRAASDSDSDSSSSDDHKKKKKKHKHKKKSSKKKKKSKHK